MPPGTTIIIRDSAPPRSAPTDTGVWFVAGIAEKGAEAPILVTSLTDFVTKLGNRLSTSLLYDAAESFFREGGGRMYVSRVLGPAALVATRTLNDAGALAALRVDAISKGAWGNSLTVQVTAGDVGGEFKIIIAHSTLGVLESSPSLADQTAALAWAAQSTYITLTQLGSALDPVVVAATALATGADDTVSITDAHWLIALNRFSKALGPGQVSFPGRSAGTAHSDLVSHALANNRIAILDAADTAVVATVKATATALRLLNASQGPRFAGVFAPWLRVPGLTPGTLRTIPPSGTVAGMMARLDGQTRNPNLAAAGINGISQFALSAKVAFTDAERDDLNLSGVSVVREVFGSVRLYGYRTAVDQLIQPLWTNLANSRLVMAVAAKSADIAERYVLAQLDGRRMKVNEFGGELSAMLADYFDLGALFGETAADAFNVDVGVAVNTPATMAAGQLKAILALRCSPYGEMVIVELVKVAATEAVA